MGTSAPRAPPPPQLRPDEMMKLDGGWGRSFDRLWVGEFEGDGGVFGDEILSAAEEGVSLRSELLVRGRKHT